MRRGIRRRHQGPPLAPHRAAGARGGHQPPPSRGVRLRDEHRRRRRHVAAAAAPVLPEGGRPARHRTAGTGGVRRRHGVPAARRRPARAGRGPVRTHRRRGRPAGARLAQRTHGRRRPRPHGAQRRAAVPPNPDRPRRGAGGLRRRARPLRTQAVRHPQAGRTRRRAAAAVGAASVLHRQPVVEHHRLQGHADRRPDGGDVPRPLRSGRRVGPGARAPAVLHQHVPVLAARPSVPLRRAQRGDQHAARQHQLDAGARGAVPLRPVRRRSRQAVPAHPRGAERHRHVRQCARVPRAHRPPARARRADDDSGAVEQPRVDEPGAEGVLPVPRFAHGAVGRAGVDRVHRRHRDRRGARPQRPAPLALLRDEGRHGDHGVRGRRARRAPGECPGEGAAAPGPHLPGRHRPGPHHRRRGDQGRPRRGAPVQRVAGAGAGAPARPAAGRRRAGPGPRRHSAPAARLRVHRGGPADHRRPDGRARRRADRLHGDRHGPGGAVRPLAAALRLLQAAVRPGHQPAARRHPRGTGDRHGLDARLRAQPAEPRAGVVPPGEDRRPPSSTTTGWRSCAPCPIRRSAR